jgi:hypothetical protein
MVKIEIDNLPNVPLILAMTFNMTCPSMKVIMKLKLSSRNEFHGR